MLEMYSGVSISINKLTTESGQCWLSVWDVFPSVGKTFHKILVIEAKRAEDRNISVGKTVLFGFFFFLGGGECFYEYIALG